MHQASLINKKVIKMTDHTFMPPALKTYMQQEVMTAGRSIFRETGFTQDLFSFRFLALQELPPSVTVTLAKQLPTMYNERHLC